MFENLFLLDFYRFDPSGIIERECYSSIFLSEPGKVKGLSS